MNRNKNNFNAVDFLSLFCAECLVQREQYFNRTSLEEFIGKCMENNNFQKLLNKSVVEGLDDAFIKLQGMEAIYPSSNNSFFIDVNTPISSLIERKIDYYCDMADFYIEYTRYRVKRQSDIYQKIYEQEEKDIEMAVKVLEKFKKGPKKN